MLKTLSEEFEDECCVALIQTIERHVTEAEQVNQLDKSTKDRDDPAKSM